MMKKCVSLILGMCLIMSVTASATVLTFEAESDTGGGFAPIGNGVVFGDSWLSPNRNESYGDFVAGATQTGRLLYPGSGSVNFPGIYHYGETGEGFTPNIRMYIDELDHGLMRQTTWSTYSSSLSLFATVSPETNGFNFFGENGAEVVVLGVESNGWAGSVIPVTVEVWAISLTGATDGSQDHLFTKDTLLWTSGLVNGGVMSINGGAGIQGSALRLEIIGGGGGGAKAVDNIVFSEVPEPMTICLLGLGGLFLRRRK